MWIEAGKWKEDIPAPHLRGLYDTIDTAHANSKEQLQTLGTPFAATGISRNLIHSIWAAYTDSFVWMTEDDMVDDELEFNELNVDEAIQHSKANATFKTYQNNLQNLHNLRRCIYEVRRNQHAFTATHAKTGNGTEKQTNKSGKTEDFDLEQERWTRLEERLKEAADVLQTFMGGFSTRADIINAVVSGRESRSSGQLTKLATVAVPFSVVSAIFSMGGDYAAGEQSFGTYWAISVPVTAVLLLWVLFSEQLSLKRKEWRKDRSERRENDNKGPSTISSKPDEPGVRLEV